MNVLQALESVVRKKKQILVSEVELRQKQARTPPVSPSLLQRVFDSVWRSGSGGTHATAQLITSLKEEVHNHDYPSLPMTACLVYSGIT